MGMAVFVAEVLMAMAAVSVVGSTLGALLLLWLDNDQFAAAVPWLLLGATALFAAGPWLKPKPRHEADAAKGRSVASPVMQFVTSIYGGFFGAGMGIMMLAVLGIAKGGDYHRLNAMKNFIAVLIATVAIVVFVGGGVVAWLPAAVMIPGGALGGYAGVWMAKRVPQWVVRALVIIVGLLLSWYYFTK